MWIKYKLAGEKKWQLDQERASYYIGIEGSFKNDYLMLEDGWLTCFFEYEWDGASGPAIDTANAMGPSMFHDAWYQLMRIGFLSRKTRKKADKMLRKMCRENGMTRARSAYWYLFVRIFAGASAKRRKQ